MSPASSPECVQAQLPAAAPVRALSTTRTGGVSRPPFDSFNLGERAGDEAVAVLENRRRLESLLEPAASPCWLRQVHGASVVRAEPGREPEADAQWTDVPERSLAILTADCLPVVVACEDGSRLAVAHAGWRGLAAGVLENTVACLEDSGSGLCAWLGPAIGPTAYEIDEPVRAAFLDSQAGAERHFTPVRSGHWLMDLYGLARDRLRRAGVEAITGGDLCTFSDANRFYSYRRDGKTGRMATVAWITA